MVGNVNGVDELENGSRLLTELISNCENTNEIFILHKLRFRMTYSFLRTANSITPCLESVVYRVIFL